jgi:MraZ protein
VVDYGGAWRYAVFQGEYDHTIDDKGRVIIPTKIRSLLGDRFVMIKAVDAPCIWILTEAKWNSFSDELESRPQLAEKTNLLKRFFVASEGVVDGQGRVAVPNSLRAHARITEQGPVTIVGTGSRVEIWSRSEWTNYNSSITPEMIREAAEGTGI